MIAHDVRPFHPGQVPLIAAKYNLLFADVYRHFGAQPPQVGEEADGRGEGERRREEHDVPELDHEGEVLGEHQRTRQLQLGRICVAAGEQEITIIIIIIIMKIES